ncbi:MAG TPA: LacI family DNA-binding transcriptional regulator [Longimicrobiaceae bacterium]|nr:LacI family DNA-binding transcriptional regulator [Longimicrobiaceae bacterium]
MADRPTINDVAREAGVSKASVSAVINQKPGVSDATRARVQAVMERLNYRPSGAAVARGPAVKRRSIGLVIKEMDNPYYTEVATGALAEGRAHGYTVLVASSEGDYEAEKDAVELMRGQGVDGLIITPVLDEHADLSHLFELKRRNFPFVLLEEIRGVRASLVDIENTEASSRAVEHLVAEGHARIVHFAGPEYSMHSRERIQGVYRAFSRSPRGFGEDAIIPAGAHLEDGYRAALAYFGERAPSERATGVTCYNDLVAMGVMRALAELGIRVPDEVSVIGFDDLQILDYLAIPLSSVHVPKYEMGRRAAEILIRHVEADEALPPTKEYLAGELVLRGSTRPSSHPPQEPDP